MLFLKIILILHLIKSSLSHVPTSQKNEATTNTLYKKSTIIENLSKNSSIDENKKTPGFRFRFPFMDMEIQSQRNVHIMQERLQNQLTYVVHGNELYQMFISRDEKRLSLIGYLGGNLKDNEPLGAEIIDLRDFFIMVIALEEHLEVYQLSEQSLEARAQITKDPKRGKEDAPIFEPIQQISLTGRYRQHFLTDPSQERIMLIVGINFTKLYGRLNTFLWSNSYFEPIEELTIPPIHTLNVIGSYPKYLIRGRVLKHQTKTIITVAEIQSSTMTLHNTQTLTLNSHKIHISSFRGKHYLIACNSKQNQCNSFRMNNDGLFSVYKQRTSKDLAFDNFMGGKHFIVTSRQNQVMVFTNGRLDCYASFKTNDTDVTSILTLVNAHGEDFILLNYKRTFHTLVRVIELESEKGGLLGAPIFNGTEIEDTSTLFQHRHMFEETIGALRSLLLRRRLVMNVFRKILNFINLNGTNPIELNIPHSVRIHGGEIEIVKLVGKNLRSPLQLLQRVNEMRQRLRERRFRRHVDEQAKSKRLRVKHLKLRSLNYQGQIIKGFHLDSSAKPEPILSVRPKLVTKFLYTEKLSTHHIFRHPREDQNSQNSTSSVIKLKELNVVSINGVPWKKFYDSLFLKNHNTKIIGRLILQAETNVTNLKTILLNGLMVKHLFNLKEPQVVNSSILLTGMLIKDLHAESINGLDFAKDVVFKNMDTFIETPVNMYQISIGKDLLLSDSVTIQRKSSDDESEFQQHYTGKVIINGTLTVRNLMQENENTKMFVNAVKFSAERLKQNYFLYKENQNFNSSVIFGNAKVTAKSLKSCYFNDNPTEEYLLNNEKNSFKTPLLLVFMNAHIEGDLETSTHLTRIANLSRNAIRHDDVANITGTKVFEMPLTVNDVMTLSLNQMPVSELVLKSQLKQNIKFKDIKSFNNLQVNEDLTVNIALNATNLNKLPLRDLLKHDYHFERLKVPNKLEAVNIIFHKINGISFDEVFENFNERDGKLMLHKQLIIEGNLSFDNNLNVSNINGIDWRAYEADLVHVNENALIAGRKCFMEEVTITTALKTTNINDLILEKDFEYILSKSRPQLIKGIYTFSYVKFSNLDTPFVNDVPTSEFIDMRTKNIILESDIILPEITVMGNVKSNDNAMQYGLKNLSWKISQLAKQKWRNIVVTGNVYWNDTETNVKSQHELVSYLYKNAVRRTGNQVISGNVKFIRPLITNMHTKNAFPKNLDLDFLVKDCVLKSSKIAQVITAKKTFLMPLNFHHVETNGYLDTHLINGIDVLRFNASLYRLSSEMPVIGPLKFRFPPTIGNFLVQYDINGINPAMIYHNITKRLPALKISKLIVDKPLQIVQVNDESFDNLLQNRLTKNNLRPQEITAHLNFQRLVLNENNIIQNINGMLVDNLVFKKSKKLQAITGTKVLEYDLALEGPAQVMRLNGHDLIDSYQHTIFKNRNYEHDNMRVKSATFEKGLILMRDVVPMVGATHEMNFTIEYVKTELQILKDMLENKQTSIKNLLYLDYATDWQISCASPNVSIQKTYHHALKRTSLCEHQFINIYMRNPNSTNDGLIFLSNSSSSFITASAYNLSIKAENYCQQKYHKIKSKIKITGVNFTRVIGMKKFIEKILIYKPANHSDIYLLFHAIELAHNRHEVRILKMIESMQENITDWQSLTLGIGKKVKLFSFKNYTVLLSGGGLIENQPNLAIYHFNYTTSQFQLAQSIIGDFDILELLPDKTEHEFQLILSCSHCRRIHIYKYKPKLRDTTYEIFQLIKLKTLIDRVQLFRLSDGSLYMLLLGENNQHYYYLYRYSQLEGWQHTTYGYFENTKIVIPLNNGQLDIDDNNLLAILCNSKKCSVIKAVVV